MSAMMNQRPLNVLNAAATKARKALGLKYLPVVIRSEASAFAVADRAKSAVMLGEDAYWIVCLADAATLERAGYEWAPRPSGR